MKTMNRTQPITLLICALGGEGGGVLTEWLVDTARHAGYAAQSTSIPGVAQRTGATTYYVEVFPVPLAELAGRRPVFSLSPVPGALDAIISSELLETTRQIGNGMSAPERTIVITSSGRTLTTLERMQLGDGRADSADLLQIVQNFSRAHHVFDMNAVAREAGTVVSAVMLGAIAGSGLFPFPREAYERVVRGGDTSAPEKLSKMAAASLRGFAKAFEIAASQPRAAGLRWSRADAGKQSSASDEESIAFANPPRCRPTVGGPVPSASARHARAGPCARARLPGPGLRRPLRAAPAIRAGRRKGGRSSSCPRLGHHEGDGALACVVDGLRRHRSRGRTQEPRKPSAPCARRGQGGRGRHRQGLRPLQAGRARVRRAAAARAVAPGAALGPQAPGAGPGAVGHAAEDRHPQRVRHGRLAHARFAEVAARARQPFRATSSR